MKVQKSSRHSKITGDFGEHLVLYLLSKYGFECARVDHTGIDIIARHPKRKEVFGIAVQSRSRSQESGSTSLRIDKKRFEKAADACAKFMCEPYFALVIDADRKIRMYLMPWNHLWQKIGTRSGYNWSMTEKSIQGYKRDSKIAYFEMHHDEPCWGNLEK